MGGSRGFQVRVAALTLWNRRMMSGSEQKVKKEEKARVLRERNGSNCEMQDQSPTAALRDISMDSAKPRRIDPRTKAGTSRSGVNDTFVALRGNSVRRSSRKPASFRNSAEKPMSSARSTPQNHSFSSWRWRKSRASSSFFMARSKEEARKKMLSVHACRG